MRFNVSARTPKCVARSIARCALAGAALIAGGACASGHSHRGGGYSQNMVVHLTNDLAPPSDVTVYAVASGGIRRLLGDVPPNAHKVLRIPGDLFPGTTFHIVAERGLGRPVVSQAIDASTGNVIIDWDLQMNSVWFPESGD
jgi:hypothetical protein